MRSKLMAGFSDCGGVRGLSSLLILEAIMEKIRDEEGLEEIPLTCDRFDMIGGISTGGYHGLEFLRKISAK